MRHYTVILDMAGTILWTDLDDRSLVGAQFIPDRPQDVKRRKGPMLSDEQRKARREAFEAAAWYDRPSSCDIEVEQHQDRLSGRASLCRVAIGDRLIVVVSVAFFPAESSLLSDREVEILKLLASDLMADEIAAELGVARSTIDTHAYNIREKLHVRGAAGIARYAMRAGLIG